MMKKWFGKGTKKKIVVVFSAVLAVLVFSAAALFGAAAAYGAYAEPEDPLIQKLAFSPIIKYAVPAEKRGRVVLSMMLERLEDPESRQEFVQESFNFEGSIEFEAKEVRSVGDIKGTLDYTGQVSGDMESSAGLLHLDMGGIRMNVEAEQFADSERVYFKLNDFPEALFGSFGMYNVMAESLESGSGQDVKGVDIVNELETNWFAIDSDFDDAFGGVDVEEEILAGDPEYVWELLSEENAEYIGLAELRGGRAFHFSYEIQKSDLEKILGKENVSVLFEDAKLKNLRAEVWVSAVEKRAEAAFKAAIFGEVQAEDGTDVNFSVSAEIWGIGEDIELAPPEEYKDFEEFLEETRFE